MNLCIAFVVLYATPLEKTRPFLFLTQTNTATSQMCCEVTVKSPEEVQLFSNNSEARCLADVQAGFADKVASVEHVLHLLAQIRQLVRGRLDVVLVLHTQGVTAHVVGGNKTLSLIHANYSQAYMPSCYQH